MNWRDALDAMVDKLIGWGRQAILALPNLVLAVLVMVGFWIAARLIESAIRKVLGRTHAPQQVQRLLAKVVGVALLAAGLFIALGILELDKALASLLAGAGIVGLALGFAFQDIASNFIAGTLMALRRPFQIGDLIETNDFFGTVERIDLRTTVLRKPQGQLVLIPNSSVFGNPIVNYTQSRERRVDLEVGVSYGDDLERAAELAIAAVEGVEGRQEDRPVELFYQAFGGSSIDLVVRFWLDSTAQRDYLAAWSRAIQRLKTAFDDGGITIPFPIRTLDFGIVGGEKLAEALPAGLGGGRRAGGEDQLPRDGRQADL